MRPLRFLLGVAALASLVAGILAVSYMQKKFDDGDLKRAVAAVAAKFPAKECRAEVISRFRGTVRVTCAEGRWLVDVVQGTVVDDVP